MAIYHLHVKNISRGDGRSAVAAAAYRAGETLPNEAEEKESRFGGRRDVLHSEICLPADAPAWMADRGRLWNAAEAAERRKDARLAKEIEFALPRELPPAMWLSITRSMAKVYTAAGHVVDFAVHEDGTGHNPHVHLLLTTRRIEQGVFAGKLREADGLKFVTGARSSWAQIANAALAAAGAGVEVEPCSHAVAGISFRPGRHRGPDKVERRARRAQRDQIGGEAMRDLQDQLRMADSSDPDRYPVPDADGRPTSPTEQNQAEDAMIAEMEQPALQEPAPSENDASELRDEMGSEDDWWHKTGEGHLDIRDEAQAKAVDNQWWNDAEFPAVQDEPHDGDSSDRWDRTSRRI